MKKYLFLTSALVAFTMSGVTEAACIQTPSCSSLGYSSSSSCSGGVKCPFGNAWNCTGPNNTTKINSINTSITNILNRITKLENNSGSGSGSGAGSGSGSGASSLCESCNVGDFICGGKCYASSIVLTEKGGLASDCTYYVTKKENGKCTRVTTGYGPLKTLTAKQLMQEVTPLDDGYGHEYVNFSNQTTYFSLLNSLCRTFDFDESVIDGMIVPYFVKSRDFDGSYFSFELEYTKSCYPAYKEKIPTGVKCNVDDLKTCFGNYTFLTFRVPVESTF